MSLFRCVQGAKNSGKKLNVHGLRVNTKWVTSARAQKNHFARLEQAKFWLDPPQFPFVKQIVVHMQKNFAFYGRLELFAHVPAFLRHF